MDANHQSSPGAPVRTGPVNAQQQQSTKAGALATQTPRGGPYVRRERLIARPSAEHCMAPGTEGGTTVRTSVCRNTQQCTPSCWGPAPPDVPAMSPGGGAYGRVERVWVALGHRHRPQSPAGVSRVPLPHGGGPSHVLPHVYGCAHRSGVWGSGTAASACQATVQHEACV